jgi:hypothetical protein
MKKSLMLIMSLLMILMLSSNVFAYKSMVRVEIKDLIDVNNQQGLCRADPSSSDQISVGLFGDVKKPIRLVLVDSSDDIVARSDFVNKVFGKDDAKPEEFDKTSFFTQGYVGPTELISGDEYSVKIDVGIMCCISESGSSYNVYGCSGACNVNGQNRASFDTKPVKNSAGRFVWDFHNFGYGSLTGDCNFAQTNAIATASGMPSGENIYVTFGDSPSEAITFMVP